MAVAVISFMVAPASLDPFSAPRAAFARGRRAMPIRPQLMGQLFHLIEAPDRYSPPAFYTLHVWAWKDNPAGTFTNWHKNVSCDPFSGSSSD
jgi:hypothetical protein